MLIAALFALPLYLPGQGDANAQRFEVYSWWTGPGEGDGLEAMIEHFTKNNPDVDFVNAAVSGGAGSNAKAILASRLLANDPPDSYQRHAGLELQDDVRSGKVQDLTQLYQEQGWHATFPQGLLDYLTIDGGIYAVPVNIHRANLTWYSPKTLRSLGIDSPPRSWNEFLQQAPSIKAQGKTPLALGPEWTQKHLLEAVLLGELGPDQYEGLWDGRMSWRSPEVTSALNTFQMVLEFTDITSAASDWQPQLDRIIDATATYAVMGDWAYTYFAITKKLGWRQDFDVAASPGTDGVFDFLSDTFTLPTGSRHPEITKTWLIECGSTEGQNLFNPLKGSIPARTDADPTPYLDYLAWDLQEWRNPDTRIVGSLAHGVVANNAWGAEIDTALVLFLQDGDAVKFAETVATRYRETK
ncbi:MAG: carbohydrate ABC transporter substrate-binding protein [Dactylosporangium sp.]|nr:ABC transporter substrate-binding protein [Dactylosporangium sp.]NNJ62071.1 carbohydrate ABC transporter substrate-binding protein [Dactylosporangium sp.]